MESPQAFATLVVLAWLLTGSAAMILHWLAEFIAMLSHLSVRRIPFDARDNADFVFAGPFGLAAAIYALLFILRQHLRYWWKFR